MRRRRDGRAANQLRGMAVEFGLLGSADGSARLSCGDTRVLASVHGPRPARFARLEDPARAQLEVHVTPAAGAPGAAEAELAALLRQTLAPVLVLTAHPRTVISVAIHVQSDEGSAGAVALNAAVLALADAGVPMRTLVGAVTVGTPSAALAAAAAAEGSGAGSAAGAGSSSGGELLLDLTAREEGTPGEACPARALVGFTADDVAAAAAAATASAGGSSTAGAEGSAAAPAALVTSGPLPLATLGAVLQAAQPAVATVLAFLRLALRQKVMRDAVNFQGSMVVPLAELRPAAAVAAGGASS